MLECPYSSFAPLLVLKTQILAFYLSEGNPKGVMTTHKNVTATMASLVFTVEKVFVQFLEQFDALGKS